MNRWSGFGFAPGPTQHSPRYVESLRWMVSTFHESGWHRRTCYSIDSPAKPNRVSGLVWRRTRVSHKALALTVDFVYTLQAVAWHQRG
jgi:hypothetical protein